VANTVRFLLNFLNLFFIKIYQTPFFH
jgi:hypothetical protein